MIIKWLILKVFYLFSDEIIILKREFLKLPHKERIVALHTFNRWEFPIQLIHIKPKWWDNDKENYRKHNFYLKAIHYWSYQFVKQKDRLHYNIVDRLGESEEYFNDFWERHLQSLKEYRTGVMN